MKLICFYCNKTPDELGEYIELAKTAGMTPDEFVQKEEGTFNPANGHFCCTLCYMVCSVDAGERQYICFLAGKSRNQRK